MGKGRMLSQGEQGVSAEGRQYDQRKNGKIGENTSFHFGVLLSVSFIFIICGFCRIVKKNQ
jgi:hypothetical protein